jgi:transposase-like protein
MPPADQVMAAYQQIGTVTGLAEHFDVPRHTVSGWARRLRNEGHNIGRSG